MEVDSREALYWFERAAFKGDASAQYTLALLYGKGRGVKKSLDKASNTLQVG